MSDRKSITLLQINDTHGYLEPHPELFWEGGHAEYRTSGGYTRLLSVFKQVREERNGAVIALDNGDTLMKFITICDYTGIIECEIFAQTYRRFGLETVRHPVVELEARVTPFDSGEGCTLDVVRIGPPRMGLDHNPKLCAAT